MIKGIHRGFVVWTFGIKFGLVEALQHPEELLWSTDFSLCDGFHMSSDFAFSLGTFVARKMLGRALRDIN